MYILDISYQIMKSGTPKPILNLTSFKRGVKSLFNAVFIETVGTLDIFPFYYYYT